MAAIELSRRLVERIWGRTDLLPPFAGLGDGKSRIGEIWFEAPGARPELLVKYLFTSERLSIQVHPGADQRDGPGSEACKDEAWLVLDAEPGATIGLGLTRPIGREALRETALSGEIERLLDWRPVRPGAILYSPAGTIHAIGAGLSVIEIQQNCDVTYRLYDYGRPRALQIEEALSVARPGPWSPDFIPRQAGDGRTVHVEGPNFVLERWSGPRSVELDGGMTLVPVTDCGTLDGRPLRAGTVWATDGSARLQLAEGADLLVAYPGAEARP